MLLHLTPAELRRKEKERISMLEGIELWKRQKEENRTKLIREKREVRDLLEKYWPWGRPGGGAPNSQSVGLRNLNLEDIYPQEDMQKAKRQVGGFQFGRPGGGAPHISSSGQRQVGFREDPGLRFQWGQDLRRCVDNTLRYRSKKEEQEQYRKQLDALVEEKRRAKEYEKKKKLEYERRMGWTNDSTIRRLQHDMLDKSNINTDEKVTSHRKHTSSHGSEVTDGKENGNNKFYPPRRKSSGIELVPLLVKRRPNEYKVPLGSTDVTRGDTLPKRINIQEPKYMKELNQQVHHKIETQKEARHQNEKECRRHFETWNNLWGRPGHGARLPVTQKGRLMSMLYPQIYPTPVH